MLSIMFVNFSVSACVLAIVQVCAWYLLVWVYLVCIHFDIRSIVSLRINPFVHLVSIFMAYVAI